MTCVNAPKNTQEIIEACAKIIHETGKIYGYALRHDPNEDPHWEELPEESKELARRCVRLNLKERDKTDVDVEKYENYPWMRLMVRVIYAMADSLGYDQIIELNN
jgi:hypothetical protein